MSANIYLEESTLPLFNRNSLPAQLSMKFNNDFLDQVLNFNLFGKPTVVEHINGINYFYNEFWTSRQRQGHRIHEISYRACFKPELPRFFIERLTRSGDTVYDPFMGRGTTPIEAALHGRIPLGNDINPLSVAFVAPRITPPSIASIERKIKEIPWEDFREIKNKDLLVFYHPDTLAQIEGLRKWFISRQENGLLDKEDEWIRMVALNRLTGHSSGFFSVYTLPPNQAASIQSQARINERLKQTPPKRDVPKIIMKKTKSLQSNGVAYSNRSMFCTGPSDKTPAISDQSISLTVTSPPFLDIVNYESDNWLRCWFMGIDSKTINISQHRDIEAWQTFIASTLKELSRVTKIGGHIAFEVGEIRKGSIMLDSSVISAAQDLPLDVLGVLVNEQKFTKTSNCWGVSNNQAGTNSNRIIVFRRTKDDQ